MRTNQFTQHIKRIPFKLILLISLFTLLSYNFSQAAEVNFVWDADPTGNAKGYKLYFGKKTSCDETACCEFNGSSSTQGDSPIRIPVSDLSDPQNPSHALDGLDEGKWCFKLTAYNDAVESSPTSILLEDTDILSGTIAYWGFDEGEGTTARDATENGNDGVIIGATWTDGKSGSALNFDMTTSQYLILPNTVLNGLTDLTVEFWAKTTASWRGIVSGANASNDDHFRFNNQGNLKVYIDRTQWVSDVSFNDGDWHHIVVTRTNSEVKVYKDGSLKNSTTSLPTDPLIIDPNGFIIGQDQDSVGGDFAEHRGFYGILDEMVIYNRALSDSEVQQRYGLFCVLSNPPDEICDGVDNDCDGQIDENLTRQTNCGVGECAGNAGEESCSAGTWGGDTCDPLAGATSEICDNKDNDCDGATDENLTQQTNCGVGECAGNAGEESCSAGTWGGNTCDPLAGAIAEVCDDLDNNCDGQTDEELGAACAKAYWKFDENTGTVVNDATDNDNAGMINGATWTNGKSGSALNFNGTSSQYVSLPNTVLNGLTDFTVEFWTKTSGSDDGIISGANSGSDNQFLLFNQSSLKVYINQSHWISGVSFNDGNWHHIVVTRTNSEVKVYKDGTMANSTTSLPTVSLTIDPNGLIIGQEQDSVGGGFTDDQAFDGILDEMVIYNRALSGSEVQQRYEGSFCTPSDPPDEICDGIDNDCDGQIDEDIPNGCVNGFPSVPTGFRLL